MGSVTEDDAPRESHEELIFLQKSFESFLLKIENPCFSTSFVVVSIRFWSQMPRGPDGMD